MVRTILLILLLAGFQNVRSQTAEIRGKIVDTKTQELLPFANVFINQTTLGTSTDLQGFFLLKNVPIGKHELVISYLGYQTASLQVDVSSDSRVLLDVRLIPVEVLLSEVKVSAKKDKAWENDLKVFENNFFGKSDFASKCKILNPWVLDFKRAQSEGIEAFFASASDPLLIENMALGYSIWYYLKSMVVTNEGYNISGNIRYEELNTTDKSMALMWSNNRVTAFKGSYRHLFKSILQKTSKADGFYLYEQKGKNERPDFKGLLGKTVFEAQTPTVNSLQSNLFRILFPQNLEVHYIKSYSAKRVYIDVSYPVSYLNFRKGSIDVTGNGVVLNPSELVVSGAMFDSRVAELLPIDYEPAVSKEVVQDDAEFKYEKALILREKVLLQCDKSFYYPGESVLITAFMNYKSPELMDTLSRTLYVELIDQERKIVKTQVLKIDQGAANAVFTLSKDIEPGKYYLRSYTSWMINYGSQYFSVTALPILDLNKLSLNRTVLTPDTSLLHVQLDREFYSKRERVNVRVALKDAAQDQLTNLAVAVTEVDRLNSDLEMQVVKDSYFPLNDTFEVNLPFNYPIEFGISMVGEHLNHSDKPQSTSLLITDDELQNTFVIETRADGKFLLNGFQHTDSLEVNFRYIKKVKKKGTIRLIPKTVPATDHLIPYVFETNNAVERSKRMLTYDSTRSRLLDAVQIKAAKIDREPIKINPGTYGKADIKVMSSDLVKSNATSLAEALRARVAGLNVIYDNGSTYFRIGPKFNFAPPALTEPLLILDGLQIAPGDKPGAYERLNQIQTSVVDYVEVIKYGGAAVYGLRGANGVIIVNTRGGTFNFEYPDSNNLKKEIFYSVKLSGFNRPDTLRFPDYRKQDLVSGIAFDNRTTLYWNPLLKIEEDNTAEFSFFTADNLTDYKIQFLSKTKLGNFVLGSIIFTVK
jgi:hypothetical protein